MKEANDEIIQRIWTRRDGMVEVQMAKSGCSVLSRILHCGVARLEAGHLGKDEFEGH
jgi:hypothetical protein